MLFCAISVGLWLEAMARIFTPVNYNELFCVKYGWGTLLNTQPICMCSQVRQPYILTHKLPLTRFGTRAVGPTWGGKSRRCDSRSECRSNRRAGSWAATCEGAIPTESSLVDALCLKGRYTFDFHCSIPILHAPSSMYVLQPFDFLPSYNLWS